MIGNYQERRQYYKGKRDVYDKGHYRPISIICHIAKIIEREIKHQMCTYLERNALITVDQSAYCERHNTQTSLQRCLMTGIIILPMGY